MPNVRTRRTLREEGQREESGGDGAEEHGFCQVSSAVERTKESGCFG